MKQKPCMFYRKPSEQSIFKQKKAFQTGSTVSKRVLRHEIGCFHKSLGKSTIWLCIQHRQEGESRQRQWCEGV